ncbi:MAG TPA: hemolysin family protein [Natronosporangium sp.]|nr:hemolysin family protein [Natronosporangium sp.]
MDQYVFQLLVVAGLLVLNAAFAGTEMALITLREGQLRRLERQSARGAAVARLARDPNRFLATIQIGITLAGFLASATAAVTLAGPLEPAFGFLGAAARPAAVVTVTVVLTFLTLVIGELAPKRIALQRAEGWSIVAVRPLQLAAAVTTPAVWLLGRATNVAVRLAGADPTRHRDEITPAEVRDLVATHRGFTPEQRMIISGAVAIAERTLRQVLVPRRQVFTLDADTPVPEACHQLAASGHSRAPVVEHGNLDETVGVANLRDLVTGDGATLRQLARPPVLLPDSLHAAEALRRFQADRQQFALVVDEHGAVDGIITLEDLVEEVVGEIYDETDRDVQAVRREADGSLLVPGVFPVHDLPDLGVYLDRLPEGGYTTVAGLVLALLGHLPTQPGETVTVDGWSAEVVSVDHHAITSVRLRPPPPPARS